MQLREAGAEVTRLERECEMHAGMPSLGNALFAVLNRGKARLPLAELDRWLSKTDVLVHDCMLEQALRLGLDDQHLGEHFPQLDSAREQPAPAPSATTLPLLHGLRVLDIGEYLAGPFACQWLAIR